MVESSNNANKESRTEYDCLFMRWTLPSLVNFFYVVLRRLYEDLDFKDIPQFTKMEVVEHGVNKNVK